MRSARFRTLTPSVTTALQIKPRHSGLLEDSPRAGVWPDSVQVSGGFALFWAAHPCAGVALFRYATPGHRDEAWLKRGLPSS